MRRFDAVLVVPLAIVLAGVAGVLTALVLRVPPPLLLAAALSEEVGFAVALSLKVSLAALAAALILGVPAAYLLARRPFPAKALINTMLDIPMVMPPLVAGLGLLMLLSRSQLGGPLARAGINLLFSPAGAVVAQTFVCLPVVLRTAQAAFSSLNQGFAQAAATLGAGPWAVLLVVELPLAARSIAAGAVLGWSRAMGEFGATLLVAGATRFKTETLPMAVYLNVATGEIDTAIACALVLLGIAFTLLVGLRLVGGHGGQALGHRAP